MFKTHKQMFYILLFSFTILLTACSGGGGSGGDSGDTVADPAKSSEWDKMEWDKGQWG